MACENCSECNNKCNTRRELLENRVISKYIKNENLPHWEYEQLKPFVQGMSETELEEYLQKKIDC